MGLLDSFVITAGDVQFVAPMLSAAEKFVQRPSNVEMARLVETYEIRPIFRY
jgi:hypothetical protein